MSQPSRPQARGPAQRRRREFRIDAVMRLEERSLLAPFVVTTPLAATFTALPVVAATPNVNIGTVTIAPAAAGTTAATAYPTAEPVTSVNQLTPSSSFGGDIVRIRAGQGGDFGSGVYAISRGAGENTGAANRPGVIYRVDPATGKSSVFFDLNTVVSQLQPPSTSAANSVSTSSGLVNWYDIAFDTEGYFDGKPSMFVSSVDRSDPNKNAIYRIAPDGTFMGAFAQFTGGQTGVKFNANPTSILVPPPEDQSFLRGLFSGSGSTTTSGTFSALFFSATGYAPGQAITTTPLPNGVTQSSLGLGPQVGLTASNPDYPSRVYDAFTDFGTPAGPGIPAVPGLSGVQGNGFGELLIAPPATTTTTTNLTIDQQAAVTTPFRRFEDIAFDQYGYFSVGLPETTATTNGQTTFTLGTPQSAGNLFVADLASGLQVLVTPRAPLLTTAIQVPVQGPGTISLTTDAAGNVVPVISGATTTSGGNTTGGSNIGGRILRIDPQGQTTVFAQGFHTSAAQDSTSFIGSSLSITFSADGTTLYASDDDGIWQFKTTASLADSTSGSLIGLNDLQTLGTPYNGQDSAVAIIDSGVDANSSPFRGRVAPGSNVVIGGAGNDDTSAASTTATTATATNTTNTVIQTGLDGHGTLVAGVVAQFVPQATLVPVDIFNPFQVITGTTGTAAGANGGTVLPFNSNAIASSSNVYKGIKYVADNPFVNDPIRPGKTNRVIAATFGFGSQTTFNSEGVAYRQFPQLVIALKNQLKKYRSLGIAPIAAAGQFGNPKGASSTTTNAGGNTAVGALGANNAGNNNVGDSDGMALPAVLNEVVSVTGVIPFPYTGTVNSLPTDPVNGITPRVSQPVLITAGVTGTTGTTATTTNASPLGTLLLGNTIPVASTGGGNATTAVSGTFINGIPQGLYSDRVLAAANRGVTTDYAAPAVDIPTFRRTFSLVTTTTTTTTNTIDPNLHLSFNQGGTSLSAGIVAGSFSMVSSALAYWTNLNNTGVTADAYLTQPVAAHTLNFGPHPFKDVSSYNSPDGINSILAWTAVPVLDPNDGLSQSQAPYLIKSPNFRSFSRIDVGNAIAAIEGEIAIQYLLDHNDFTIMDSNKDSIITTQELQTFVDQASVTGQSEAGAMARLLGGTATTPSAPSTSFGEQPDQAGALQRRFNFFDYAADGQLNGSVTITQLKMLAHTLLPTPDAYVVNDRQRASANGYLLDPSATRNIHDLQHLSPKYEFVPKSALKKYRNITPDQFGVNRLRRNVDLPGNQYPVWTLFDSGNKATSAPTQTTISTSTATNQPTTATNSTSTQTTTAASTAKVATTNTGTATTASTANSATTPTGTTTSTTPTSTSTSTSTGTSNAIDTTGALATTTSGGTTSGSTTSGGTAATSTTKSTSNLSSSLDTATSTTPKTGAVNALSASTPTTTALNDNGVQAQQLQAQKLAAQVLGTSKPNTATDTPSA